MSSIKFSVRLDSAMFKMLQARADAEGKSINGTINKVLAEALKQERKNDKELDSIIKGLQTKLSEQETLLLATYYLCRGFFTDKKSPEQIINSVGEVIERPRLGKSIKEFYKI